MIYLVATVFWIAGFLIGLSINFDWGAFFEYRLKREEMHLKHMKELKEGDKQ